MASTKSIVLKLLWLFKQGLSFMHVNVAKDLTILRVLKFCHLIGMLVTFFSLQNYRVISQDFVERTTNKSLWCNTAMCI